MGSATLDLTTVELNKSVDITLALQDPNRPAASLGEIQLTVTLYPKTQEDKDLVRYHFDPSSHCKFHFILTVLLHQHISQQ